MTLPKSSLANQLIYWDHLQEQGQLKSSCITKATSTWTCTLADCLTSQTPLPGSQASSSKQLWWSICPFLPFHHPPPPTPHKHIELYFYNLEGALYDLKLQLSKTWCLFSLFSFPYLFFLEECFNLKENTINTGFPTFVLALGTHPLPMRQLWHQDPTCLEFLKHTISQGRDLRHPLATEKRLTVQLSTWVQKAQELRSDRYFINLTEFTMKFLF